MSTIVLLMTKFGHNQGYIDELYGRFLADPGSVSEAWREFFHDYRPPDTYAALAEAERTALE